jgi:transposase
MRVAVQIQLTEDQRRQLERYAHSRTSPVRVVGRARVVLLAGEGKQNKEIAQILSVPPAMAARWRLRFAERGLAGIEHDAPRPGRAPTISAETVQAIVRKTTQETPPDATHWSTRSMARVMDVSEATVRRIWRRHGLKPHRLRSFKLSTDPRFAEKLEDVVGLYLNPPAHALVLSLDEKSQIQALDRTQPGLPLKQGRAQTLTHDYKRHGTTTLFAALNTLDGTVIGTCMQRHTHGEWLKFLRLIDRQTPPTKDLHLIVDNYATHKHPTVQAWLARHPRFHVHFTPTSASWANMVERFFRDLTEQRIRRGVFRSVPDLIEAIEDYLSHHNRQPKPFIWTAKAADILEKVKRARAAMPPKITSSSNDALH